MNIKYLVLTIIVCINGTVKSQSDFDLSQRWFNESIYNPGATGNSFSTQRWFNESIYPRATGNSFSIGVFLHSRVQWIGIDGAPVTNVLAVDTYAENIRSGFGLVVYTDKIGYLSSWSAKLSYAYYIEIGNSSLALGLSGYLQNRNSNVSPDMFDQINDPVLGYSKINEYSPNFDFGIEFNGPVKIGLSVRHLLRLEAINTAFPAHSMNFWTYASSRFNISNAVNLEPLVSYTHRDNIGRIEGGFIVYFLKNEARNKYSDRFWIGGMYRLNKQFAVLTGINITSKIRLGYSFDYGVGDLVTISKMGTHELFLSWHFNKKTDKECFCPAYK
jgi:type IX secretion system PorP/SprF family membrane protein